jgi:hypothetical protein
MDDISTWSPADIHRRTSLVPTRSSALGAAGGVVLVVERIEYTDQRVWLQARAVLSDEVERLTLRHWAESRAWRDRVAADGWDAAGDPPTEPVTVMTEIDVRLLEAGASGHFDRVVSYGGSGTERIVSWDWPRPVGDAWTFAATSPDGEVVTLRVDPRRLG